MRASDQIIIEMTQAAGAIAEDVGGFLVEVAVSRIEADLTDSRKGYDAMLVQTLVTKYGCKILASDGTPLTFL